MTSARRHALLTDTFRGFSQFHQVWSSPLKKFTSWFLPHSLQIIVHSYPEVPWGISYVA